MKFFVKIANAGDVNSFMYPACLDGVVIENAQQGRSTAECESKIAAICRFVKGSVKVKLREVGVEAMVDRGKRIAAAVDNVVVGLPATWEGVHACGILSDAGVLVDVGFCRGVLQALIAAKAGAAFVSFSIRELESSGEEIKEVLHEARAIYDSYEDLNAYLVVDDVPSLLYVRTLALLGADVAILSPLLFEQIFLERLGEGSVRPRGDGISSLRGGRR